MTKAPDPVYVPDYPVECTSSSAAPVLDSLGLGYFVLNTIVVADDSATYGTGAVLLSGGLGVMFLASAMTGFSSSSHCDSVKELNAMCVTGNDDACRHLSPVWRPHADSR